MSVRSCIVLYLMSIFLVNSSINGQVTAPPSTAAALGDDVSLECTTAQDNPTFIWADGDDGVVIYFGDSRATGEMEHTNVELGTSSNPQISILNINAIEINDDGNYTCYLHGQSVNDATETMVTVEVGSSPQDMILTSNDTHYQATCEALESKPAETITWFLNDVEQTDGIEVTTLDATPPLSSIRSTFTFQATKENYNDELRCVIGGHQVTKLNREESRLVDDHNPPETEGIIIQLNSDGASLTVSCNINTAVDPAKPAMDMFYIYENGTLISKPLSDNTVTIAEPEQDTEYMCVGGNYLGNTTATRTYQPGSSIIYEFISGGTLLTHLQMTGVQSQPTYSNLKPNRVRIDEGSLLNFAWQIAKGMQFLASKKIIHGTLCAHNVLLDERKKCKLSDYGLASTLFSKRGKPTRWSSPEAMVAGVQSTEGDIWSFGIVLWEVVTLGARPYPNMTFDIVQKEVTDGYKMPRPRHCGQEVYTIMSLCWEKETKKRSSFDQILKNLERILEKTHNYLSLNDLDEGLYASTLDI